MEICCRGFGSFSALLRLLLKETPRYLYNKGRYEELDQVLDKVIYTQLNPNRGISQNARLLDSAINFPETKEETLITQPDGDSLLKELFSQDYMKSTIILSIV